MSTYVCTCSCHTEEYRCEECCDGPNANLIAAPELLETAEQSIKLLESRHHFGQGSKESSCWFQPCASCQAYDLLKAAVQKAKRGCK